MFFAQQFSAHIVFVAGDVVAFVVDPFLAVESVVAFLAVAVAFGVAFLAVVSVFVVVAAAKQPPFLAVADFEEPSEVLELGHSKVHFRFC